MAIMPERMYKSIGLSAAARTRTRTCPGPTTGRGSSPTWMTSGGPVFSMKAARIGAAPRRGPGVIRRGLESGAGTHARPLALDTWGTADRAEARRRRHVRSRDAEEPAGTSSGCGIAKGTIEAIEAASGSQGRLPTALLLGRLGGFLRVVAPDVLTHVV